MSIRERLQRVTFGFGSWEWSLVLLVIGTRLTVYAYAGSPLPYYDQWIAEFNNTLMGVATNQDFSALFDRHNEHLLASTKLLTLIGVLINGYWDVAFLVGCAAVLRALTAGWAFQMLSAGLVQKKQTLLWLACVAIFAVPLSAYNFLSGMQISFYLADCAMLWSLRTVVRWRNPSTDGIALVGGTLFGLISMGSAVAIPAVTFAAHWFSRQPRRGFWLAWLISAGLAGAYVISARQAGIIWEPQDLGILAKIIFWWQMLAWPTPLAGLGLALLVLAFFLGVKLRQQIEVPSARLVIAGLAVYAGVNVFFIALTRDASEWHMRHWESIAWLPLAIMAAGLHADGALPGRRIICWLQIALASAYIFYGATLMRNLSWPYLKEAHANKQFALDHYRTLLLGNNYEAEIERQKAFTDHSFFDDPIGRFTIHYIVLTNLHSGHANKLALLHPAILPIRPTSVFGRLTQTVVSWSWLLGVAGIIGGVLTSYRALYSPQCAGRVFKIKT